MAVKSYPDKDYDILTEYATNPHRDRFRVTFDFFSPRAHFIILSCVAGHVVDILEWSSEDVRAVVELALLMKSELKLRTAALSLHRGSWASDSHKFHLHIVVDVDDYVRIFREQSSKMPMSAWWPNLSLVFVTHQWVKSNPRGVISKLSDSYEQNVRGYPYEKRKKNYKEKNLHLHTYRLNPGLTVFDGSPIIYHSDRRRIGIQRDALQPETDQLYQFFAILDRLATETGANSKARNEGCHIVISLDKQGFDGFGSKVYGYLLVSGDVFMRNCPPDCPPERRADWLRRYNAHSDDKVFT